MLGTDTIGCWFCMLGGPQSSQKRCLREQQAQGCHLRRRCISGQPETRRRCIWMISPSSWTLSTRFTVDIGHYFIFQFQGFGCCISPEVSQPAFPRCVLTGRMWPRSPASSCQEQLDYGGSVTGPLNIISFSLSHTRRRRNLPFLPHPPQSGVCFQGDLSCRGELSTFYPPEGPAQTHPESTLTPHPQS